MGTANLEKPTLICAISSLFFKDCETVFKKVCCQPSPPLTQVVESHSVSGWSLWLDFISRLTTGKLSKIEVEFLKFMFIPHISF